MKRNEGKGREKLLSTAVDVAYVLTSNFIEVFVIRDFLVK